MTTGVFAYATAAVPPFWDPAATLVTTFLDRDGPLVRAEHEYRAVAAADVRDVAAT